MKRSCGAGWQGMKVTGTVQDASSPTPPYPLLGAKPPTYRRYESPDTSLPVEIATSSPSSLLRSPLRIAWHLAWPACKGGSVELEASAPARNRLAPRALAPRGSSLLLRIAWYLALGLELGDEAHGQSRPGQGRRFVFDSARSTNRLAPRAVPRAVPCRESAGAYFKASSFKAGGIRADGQRREGAPKIALSLQEGRDMRKFLLAASGSLFASVAHRATDD